MRLRSARSFAARALPLLGALALIAAATWKLTAGDRVIARGDLLLYFYPLRDYASRALLDGQLPLWNPYTFMGAPFLANSQAGFFYPFNVLTAWLPSERAINVNIVLHLGIAAIGAYALARRGLGLGALASFASAIAFGLGGYLGAQVEHINQVQVLAWLPLEVLCALEVMRTRTARRRLRPALALACLLALQALAGHTQSLYICGMAVGAAALGRALLGARARPLRETVAPFIWIGGAAALAALLAAAQLAPTLELAGQSARSGGLTFSESAAFSWRPWVVGRALLPTYGDPLFAEYVAYVGAAGLALALLGALPVASANWRGHIARGEPLPPRAAAAGLALGLAGLGFILALGQATPLFAGLHRWVPGFNLFRAQARWLIVFALGLSMLIGLGVQLLRDGSTPAQRRAWWIGLALAGAGVPAAVWLGARVSPEAEYRALPAPGVLVGWVAAFAVSAALAAIRRPSRMIAPMFTAALAAELLIASQAQPYARASDRQAFTGLRPSTAYLLANAGEGRVLALSSLSFDPGDLPEQTLLYGSALTPDELYDRVIASKHKEILSPNLSLHYRVPSVDGYDGGLLPLRRYADFTAQFVARDEPGGGGDGRLREFLKSVPADAWLSKMGVRYLIADKTQDIFIDGVYYDTLFVEPLAPDRGSARPIPLAPYASTALGIVLDAPGALAGEVTFDDGSVAPFAVQAAPHAAPNTGRTYGRAAVEFGRRRAPASARVWGAGALMAVTSIDATDGTFLSQMVAGDHRMALVHSGDVKIYENLNPAPRALLRQGDRDVPGAARVIAESPGRVTVSLQPVAGQVVLREACYPGWVARADGREVPVACAEEMFLSATLGAGASTVEFSYEPESVRAGLLLSATGAAVYSALLVLSALRARRRAASTASG